MSFVKYTYGNSNIHIHSWNERTTLSVGKFCSIADNIDIFLGGNHRSDWVTTFPFGHINKDIFTNFNGKGHPKTNGNVVIGNDVWIASNVTIMSGIQIGDGAVIAANSMVVKDIAAYEIWGGNPAKKLKMRFSDEIIKSLLKLKWWEWKVGVIKKLGPRLSQAPDAKSIDELAKEAAQLSLEFS